MRSSTSPARLFCTQRTPATNTKRAKALKKMIRRVRPEKRARRIGNADTRSASPPASATGRSFPLPAGNGETSGPALTSSSTFLVAIADAIERLDGIEVVVDHLEFLAQPLDVAVYGAVVHVDLIVICGVHQIVAALDEA